MASVETEPLLYLDGEDHIKPGEDLIIMVIKEFLSEHIADSPVQQNNINHCLLDCFLPISSYVLYSVLMISNHLFDLIAKTIWLLNNLRRRLFNIFITIQKTEIVDHIESRGVIEFKCFLALSQCSYIHLLRLIQLALIIIQITEIINHVKSGDVIEFKCFLFPSQHSLKHHCCSSKLNLLLLSLQLLHIGTQHHWQLIQLLYHLKTPICESLPQIVLHHISKCDCRLAHHHIA